jgi:hypothetical protein
MSALGLPGFVQSDLRQGVECLIKTGLNSSDDNSKHFTVYPNPFQHSTTIAFPSTSNSGMQLKMYDTMNRLVREEKINPISPYTFYRNDLPQGVYFIQLIREGENLFSQKLIIE